MTGASRTRLLRVLPSSLPKDDFISVLLLDTVVQFTLRQPGNATWLGKTLGRHP